MKLLFDHNLSPRLVDRFADRYPGSSHVFLIGLERKTDLVVWVHAQTNNYSSVTKDADFSDMSVLRGFPPKVIWLRLGNCTTAEVERTLHANADAIIAFVDDPTLGVLELL